MPWEKKGLIFGPSNGAPWMKSHAQIPTPIIVGDRIKVFFSSRPEAGVSLTGSVDVDIRDPAKILNVRKTPIVDLGGPGSFDEFGVMPSTAMFVGDEMWLYSIGWQRGKTVPYLNAIGLLVSHDRGETFERPFVGPVLDRTPHEPYSTMSPCVMRFDDSWHAWYGSGTDWVLVDGKYEPIYIIKYARSADGLVWDRPNIASIAPVSKNEASTRPTILRREDRYEMWFSYRGPATFRTGSDAYRIGYATSDDGHTWIRNDDAAGITLGAPGQWDSHMMAYPAAIATPYGTYLFYNGNGFGVEGFGFAVWRD